MRGDKSKGQKVFSSVNMVLEAVSAADREAAQANQSRYLHQMGVLKYDQGAEVGFIDRCNRRCGHISWQCPCCNSNLSQLINA